MLAPASASATAQDAAPVCGGDKGGKDTKKPKPDDEKRPTNPASFDQLCGGDKGKDTEEAEAGRRPGQAADESGVAKRRVQRTSTHPRLITPGTSTSYPQRPFGVRHPASRVLPRSGIGTSAEGHAASGVPGASNSKQRSDRP